MATERRIGTEESPSRHALLDAAEALLIEEGYAAVTSRKVADRAGLKPQLVHYYFRSMDDLFIALLHRGADRGIEYQRTRLKTVSPLRALWEFNNDPQAVALYTELFALANHRKNIREAIAVQAERFREVQIDAARRAVEAHGLDASELSPETLTVLVVAVARVLAMEEALGVRGGHDEAEQLVEQLLSRYEPTDDER